MPKKLRFKHDATRLERERRKERRGGEGGKRDSGALRVSDHVLPTIQLTRDTLGLLESLVETLSGKAARNHRPIYPLLPRNHPSPHKADPKCPLDSFSFHTSCKNITIRVLRFRVAGDASISYREPYRSSRPTRCTRSRLTIPSLFRHFRV